MSNANEIDVAVLVGGASPEADVSRRSGAAVAAALKRRGYRVRMVEADRTGLAALAAQPPAVAWLATHGPYGEDGALQGALEILGIPYTGSGVLASAVAMDKRMTYRLVASAGVRVNDYRAVTLADADTFVPPATWPGPWIVKPNRGGSSLATTRVFAADQLRAAIYKALALDDVALVEPLLIGREYSVAALDDRILGEVEVVAKEGFYDNDAKYVRDDTVYVVAPAMAPALRAAIHEATVQVIAAIGAEGPTRSDFIVDSEGRAWFLEINTIPGLTDKSLLPKIAAAAGLSFDDLIEQVLWEARCKC